MTACVVCSKPIESRELFIHPQDKAAMHSSCAEVYMPKSAQAASTQPIAEEAAPGVVCQQCGGAMNKTTKADKNIALQVVGVLVFLIGFGLLFMFPLGTIAGLILMIAAARLGYKKTNVWKCASCGYFFERA